MREHFYSLEVKWTGNLGKGTSGYTHYSRNHEISAEGKYATINASSDPAFRGEKERYNPEELFLSSISTCHMLWYLHLCADNGITVVEYIDQPEAIMEEETGKGGRFTHAVLKPKVSILEADKTDLAQSLHNKASEFCFTTQSVNFPVDTEGKVVVHSGYPSTGV